MMLIQFQFMDIDEDDLEAIPEYCGYVINQIINTIDTKINRLKINARLSYIINKVSWINWNGSNRYNTTADDLMNAIKDGIIATEYKNNLWKIEIDSTKLIPNSSTSIDRFIRFLNYGDSYTRATGIFTKLEKDFNHIKLMSLWKYFAFQKFGEISSVQIISK